MHQYILAADRLKSSFAEQNMGVLVDTKLNNANSVLGRGGVCKQVEAGDPAPHLSTGEVSPGIWYPELTRRKEAQTYWRVQQSTTMKDWSISPVRKG